MSFTSGSESSESPNCGGYTYIVSLWGKVTGKVEDERKIWRSFSPLNFFGSQLRFTGGVTAIDPSLKGNRIYVWW